MDRRRKRVAGTPGTLWIGKNVHVTRGGDIDRRKRFQPEFNVAGTFGAVALRAQVFVFGSADLAATMPIGVQYQRLQAPGSPAMAGVLAAKAFEGKLYVIAEYADGNICHFYDGARVPDWDAIAVDTSSFDTVAKVLANKIQGSSAVKAESFASKVTVTALTAGTPFTISASATNGAGANDQTLALTTIQANVVAVAEVLATAHLMIVGGTENAGTNEIRVVQINGVDLLSRAVAWTGSHAATAIRLAAEINFGLATHGYTASASGDGVVISAAAGTGTAPNGFGIVTVTHGDVVMTADAAMAGGVSAVEAKKQVVSAALGGTFELDDTFAITVNGTLYKTTGRASGTGRSLFIDKSRVWSPVGSLWRYCMLNRADIWDPAHSPPVTDNDAGFINIASEAEGNENIQVAARYQALAAIFSPDNIVLFQLDTDPAHFAFSDTLENTGTNSVDSVVRYGNNDVFYLDITGIRSLRARDASNAPFVSDIGNAIDTFVADQLALLSGEQVTRAVAAIEPIDGRYLLFVGNIAFVLSYFPGAKISAWTYYGIEEFGGFNVQAAVRVRNRLYVRAGDFLYVYGGLDGNVYPGDDEIVGTVETPFLSGKTPATIKSLEGFDCAATNTWEAEVAFDPNDDMQVVNVGRLDRITFADQNKIAMPGQTSMIALKMNCRTAGPASISMVAVHYEGEESPG